MVSVKALEAAWKEFQQTKNGQAPCHRPREWYALNRALAAAAAIDGDYNAGVEDALRVAYAQGAPFNVTAEIRKLKKD